MSMTEKLEQKVAAAAARGGRDADKQMQLAQIFDATDTGPVKDPDYIHPFSLYGSVGSLNWKAMAPGDVLILMDAFPDVMTAKVRKGGSTAFRPVSNLTEDDDGFAEALAGNHLMKVSKGEGYETVDVEWYTESRGVLFRISAELKKIHRVTPIITGRVRTGAGHVVTSIDNVELVHPLGSNSEAVRYARANQTSYNPFTVYGDVRADVERMAAVCDEIERDSREAYSRDATWGLPAEPAGPPYERSGKLKAGSVRQYNELNTEAARQDMALAKKHWAMYVQDREIESESDFFDHYAWASAWLERAGLNPDPQGPGEDGYRYGSAWL